MADYNRALVIENLAQRIISEQERTMVSFDYDMAKDAVLELERIKDDVYRSVRPELKPFPIILESLDPKTKERRYVKKKLLKDGRRVKAIDAYCEESGLDFDSIGNVFSRIAFEEPCLTKRDKLAKQLMQAGWKPKWTTENGAPQIVRDKEPCPNLIKLGGKLGELLPKYYVASHRASQIEGFFKHLVQTNDKEYRIPSVVNLGSTSTFRCKHRVVCNIPKASDSVFFGKEMRSLFKASNGFEVMGWDASGLEGRVAAHYTHPIDNGEFANELLNGDIHTKNAEHFSIDRSTAKIIYYGLMYGAQSGKVKQILNCSKKDAERVFEEFWNLNYSLGVVRDKCIRSFNTLGYVPGLDGRKIWVRSEHSAMNALFQSCGAIIMTYTMVLFHKLLQENKCNLKSIPKQVIFYHDEFLNDFILPDDKELLETLAKQSIEEAGNINSVRVPLTADVQFGKSWAEVH